MDLGIKVKCNEFEMLYHKFKNTTISKKDLKTMKRLLNDLIYFLKKEAKRNTSDDIDTLITKYQKMYDELCNT